MSEQSVEITVNGKTVSAKPGEMVIAAAERAGDFIPRFCYHPRMSSVGMCRQCLVEIDTGRGPMLQPSCMVPVSPGMTVDTESETTKRAQEGILELLLANHPLDCPVCDKGGECPLQDQAFSHGPGESRYIEEKRHYEKPIEISSLIMLDRERCVLCDRCTRFADEVAGDPLIHFVERGNATQVMTYPDEPFSSHFSGNTAQICPVGALTAKPYRFKARPWDLEQVNSTCTSCSVGCEISVHSSRDQVLRYQGIDNDDVNWGWLCDRGRFNFESIHAEGRVTEPLIKTADGHQATSWNAAMSITTDLLKSALESTGPSSIGVIGGARGTNEDAWAWAQLCSALGIDRRDPQLGDGLPAALLGMPRATIREMASASTVVLMAPDLKEELPVLYLRLRDAVVNGSTKIIEFTSTGSGLTRHAWRSVRHGAGDISDVVTATLADPDVQSQLTSGPVVVIAGRSNLATSAEVEFAAVQQLVASVDGATVLPALRRGNVVGALQAGLAPSSPQHDSTATLTAAAGGSIEVLVLLGSDPLADFPDRELAIAGLNGAGRVVSITGHMNASSVAADVVLPAAVMSEKAGSTTNLEGRISSVSKKVNTPGVARADWMIAVELADRLGSNLGVDSVEEISAQLASAGAGVGTVWSVPFEVTSSETSVSPKGGYDIDLVVSRVMYDGGVATASSPSLAGLAQGRAVAVNPDVLEQLGVSTGDMIRLVSERGSVELPVCPDGRLSRDTVWAAFGQPDRESGHGDIRALISSSAPVSRVRIERVS